MKDSTLAGPSGKSLQRANHKDLASSPRGVIRGATVLESGLMDSPSVTTGLTISNAFDSWDVTGLLGAELLNDAVRKEFSPSPVLFFEPFILFELYKSKSNVQLKGYT